MGRKRYSGYRSKRGRSRWPIVLWLGIGINVLLIGISLSRDSSFDVASLFLPTADAGRAAELAFEAGDLDAAVTQGRAAVQANPQDGAALLMLARALVYRSYVDFDNAADVTDALTITADAANRLPDSADVQAAYAFALQANGQAQAAVNAAEAALDDDPNHTLARTALALAYARAGSFDVARRESEAAIANDANTSQRFDARRALAISLADLGQYADAGDQMAALIADYDTMIPLYYERALYARQVSDPDIAESAYLRVVNLDPANTKARLRLCEMTEGIGERDSALQYCQQITQHAPTLPAGWYRLGRLYFLGGDYAAARDTLNQCSTLQVRQNVPPNQRIFECWYLQGQAAEILGDCPSLVATYNEFQLLAAGSDARETWTYPPEGPPMCVNAE